MFEINEIMRQRESKVFAEILNRFRESNYTDHDILKIKERIVNDDNSLINVAHIFKQKKNVKNLMKECIKQQQVKTVRLNHKTV